MKKITIILILILPLLTKGNNIQKDSTTTASDTARVVPMEKNTFKVGNSSVTEIKVYDNTSYTSYKRVTHQWGGVYYFKNDKPTSEEVWDANTKN